MAFVTRSDREITLSTLEPNKLGPGQYTTNSERTLKTEPHAPFNTTTKRESNYESNSPGPAAYDTRKNILKKNFGINNTSPERKNIDLYSNEQKENLFISSEPRFKPENLIYLNPGPGTYNLNDRYNTNNNNINLIPKKTIKNDSLSPKRISSIPSKENCYGYLYNKDGELNLQKDPKINEKYSGEKNNSVGPGRYDIINKKKITGNVNFEKSLGHDNNLIKNENNIEKELENSLSSEKLRNKIISEIKKEKMKKNKLYKNGELKYENEIKKEIDLDNQKQSRNKNEMPGPGSYYSEYGNAIIMPKSKDIKFQNFGSSLSRSLNSIPRNYINSPLDNIMVYPSLKENNIINNTYNYKNQIRPNSNIKEIEHQKNIINQLKKIKKKESSLVGPGTYNVENKFKRPTSNIQLFNSMEVRFKENEFDNKNPGAGSYLSLLNWIPPHQEFNKEKFQEEMIIIELERKRMKNIVTGPSAADYSVEKCKSIESDIKKDINKNRPPFNFSEKRFNNFDNKFNNGPGSYNLRKDNYGFKNNKVPFSVGAKRVNNNFELNDYNASPASYDRDSYFDWNKKSFNVLFV